MFWQIPQQIRLGLNCRSVFLKGAISLAKFNRDLSDGGFGSAVDSEGKADSNDDTDDDDKDDALEGVFKEAVQPAILVHIVKQSCFLFFFLEFLVSHFQSFFQGRTRDVEACCQVSRALEHDSFLLQVGEVCLEGHASQADGWIDLETACCE